MLDQIIFTHPLVKVETVSEESNGEKDKNEITTELSPNSSTERTRENFSPLFENSGQNTTELNETVTGSSEPEVVNVENIGEVDKESEDYEDKNIDKNNDDSLQIRDALGAGLINKVQGRSSITQYAR